MLERQQDAGAVNFKTNRDLEQLRQGLPDGLLFFRLDEEEQEAAVARTANFAAFGSGSQCAFVIRINLFG